MCLDCIDCNIEPHDEGFKILQRLTSGIFTPIYFPKTQYTFRKWFDAKTFDKDNEIKIIKTSDGKPYPAGFHYYLNLEDAISHAARNRIVARIKIKNILVTGLQDEKQAGVSEYMMLMKIVRDTVPVEKYRINPQINDIITESLKPLLNILRHSHGKVSDKTVQKIGELASKTDENFVDYVTIVDSLRRQGEAFKTATEIHHRALKLVPRYLDYHTRIMASDLSLLNKLSSRKDELFDQGYRDL